MKVNFKQCRYCMIKHSMHNGNSARNSGGCKLFEAANAYLRKLAFMSKPEYVTIARDKCGPQANIYLTTRSECIHSINGLSLQTWSFHQFKHVITCAQSNYNAHSRDVKGNLSFKYILPISVIPLYLSIDRYHCFAHHRDTMWQV